MTTNPDPSFATWLAQYGHGSLDDKLTAALAEVAQQVALLDKSGKLTLTLNVAAKAGGVVVTPDLKVSAPESKQSGQFFYVTPAGALSKRDPNQPTLPNMEDTAS
ncbi:hypothetical protein UFOVP314_16 [uncultured Caudovirales phage]|uniref:Uncharacterized protein n=1 Tax=uncultured Caudovirales phage TaxID=2100421 RepID=A0A6J5LV14_9CAUD|nr:hypothetical protein UFOVP314_16 [uncultured Caudovirales phage]